jgi:FkbM family methyltransferase
MLKSETKHYLILRSTGLVTRELFSNLLKILEVNFLIECGANDASVSREFISGQPNRKALAIEANPLVYERFKSINSEFSQLKYVNVGISSHNSRQPFYVPNITDPSTSIFGSFQRLSLYEYDKPMIVDIKQLDHFKRQIPSSATSIALWIDVEGEVGRLLLGAKTILSDERVKMLYCELQDDVHYRDEKSAMEISYELSKLGFFPIARDFLSAPLYNMIFVRSESLSRVQQEISSHFRRMEFIKIPFFVFPDFKTKLSKIKRRLLKIESRKWQSFVHQFSAILGSASSKSNDQQ